MSEAQILPGKVRGFRIRVLISRGESAEADTEPEADIGALPEWEVFGMAAIARAVFDVVTGFHAGRHDPAPDLTLAKLEHRLPSLRVTLSRGKGSVWWRVPYEVAGFRWAAAVRVVRAT